MDPLTDIENKQAQHDIGRFAANVYRGAKAESDNWRDAFWATVAYFIAVLKKESEE